MSVSVMAVDEINSLATIVYHDTEKGIENEYQATFKITFNGNRLLARSVGPAYHLESEISRIKIPKEIMDDMIWLAGLVFVKPIVQGRNVQQLSLEL